MALSRLGPHVIRGTPEALTWASTAAIVKGMGTVEPLQIAHPDALRVYRWPFNEVEQDAVLRLTDAAWVVGKIVGGLAGYRHPRLYVELLNEVHRDRTAEYIALARAAVPLLHAAGLKVALPSWSTGGFEAAHWEAWRAAGWASADAIALHAYWANQGFTIWHAVRWRQYWRPGDPPVAVTEAGRDAV